MTSADHVAAEWALKGQRGSPGSPRADLAGMDFPAFSAWCAGLVGHHPRFHRAAYRQLMAEGRWAPGEVAVWREAERTSPGVIAVLAAAASERQRPEISVARAARDALHGETVKVLSRLDDGREVESVLIPMRSGAHHTVCVSSQVGCKMGCSFCHTARMGLVRQLAAHEIVGQVLAVAAHTGVRPRNLVFMGMGEPLDNLDEVAAAVRVLTDVHGLGMASRRITISTVGRVDGLERLAGLGLLRVNLAVSLTAAEDGLRSSLMPVNRVYGLERLKQALLALPLAPDRRLLISYVLIGGLNDRPEQARMLAGWVAGLRVQVNLIPFNPIPDSGLAAPSAQDVAAFGGVLAQAGVPFRVRATKGGTVMAACGQLGDPARRRASSYQAGRDAAGAPG